MSVTHRQIASLNQHQQEPAHRQPQPAVAPVAPVAGPVLDVLTLQRRHGNQHAQRVISRQTAIQRSTFDEAKNLITTMAWNPAMVYYAIQECADRPKLKADPAVMAAIRANLSGKSLWKAQLLLEYGNESSYPPGVNEIWEALDQGFFADVLILQALQKMNLTNITQLNRVPGLTEILRTVLSTKDLNDANAMLSGNYARQLALHKANVAFMKTLLNSWRAPTNPENVRNTAEWLYPSAPGVKPKNDLFVLTPTHDSAARATAQGQTNALAYFGDQPQFPADTADYDPDITSTRNIHYSAPTVQGEHNGRLIWAHNPSVLGGARLVEVLVHEVQHDADRHDLEAGHDAKGGSPDESWNRYKTEFRAYWMDGNRDTLSTVSNPALAPFDNQKQQAIFAHMYGTTPTDVYATWLRPNYDGNTLAFGQKFKDLVHGYKTPEGVNLVNSPRIDDFYLLLDKCKQSDMSTAVSPLKEVEAAARALTADDQRLLNAAQARRLQEMMKDHLWPPVLIQIAMIVNGGTPPAWVATNISSARQTIEEAMVLWVDETSVFNAIENATPAERDQMKTDDRVRAALFTHLKGRQLWKALLMLDYGPENRWPAPLTQIWIATSTFPYGVNKPMIRGALEQMGRTEVDKLARNEGLRGMIDTVLTGTDKSQTDDLLKGAYADAITNHQRDVTAIKNVIAALAKSADTKEQENAAILADAAKAPIHAMTRTHDSTTRVITQSQTGDAYFGADAIYPNAANYDSQPSSTKGIQFVPSGTQRDILTNALYLYDARAIPAADIQIFLEAFAVSRP